MTSTRLHIVIEGQKPSSLLVWSCLT